MSPANRDTTIDGFRALAALGVVFAHAVSYRFASLPLPGWRYIQALAEPLSQTSVQIFFVVSGYIITTLLLAEEVKRGAISIRAFYARRVCRILPPLFVFYATLLLFRANGIIALDNASLASSATFTCNTGLVDCQWWVAHTWSLAVEEQFYLVWPMLLLLVRNRTQMLIGTIAALLLSFLVRPFAWHSNYISFACIGMGSLYASSPRLQAALTRGSSLPLWFAAGALVVAGPLVVHAKAIQAAMPFLILYLVFAARELTVVRSILALKPIQWIGLGSYSLYLWQQLFLGKASTLPVWLLPIVVFISVLFIEQPFIRIGRRLSRAITGTAPATVEQPAI